MTREQDFFRALGQFSCVRADMSTQMKSLFDWNQALVVDLRHKPELGKLDAHSDLGKLATAVGVEIADAVEGWSQRWDQGAQARLFGDSFADRVVLLVFGKVNSGKSAFCNFFAERFAATGGSVRRFYLENNQRVDTEEAFAEGAIETTARIQGVELGEHLVLIDTPGLHSVTAENGDLTKRYTDAADAVLWLTNSVAPGQVQELDALKEELGRKKPLFAVITRSDRNEIDEVDGQIVKLLVNKTPENRAEQETDVFKRIKERASQELTGVPLRPPVSISVFYAKHNADRPQAMEEAGFERLFAGLSEIAREALAYKREKPVKIARAHIEQVVVKEVESLVRPRLWALRDAAQAAESDLDKEAKRIAKDAVRDALARLPQLVDRFKEASDKKGLVLAVNALCAEVMTRHIGQAVSKHFKSVDQILFELSADSMSGYERKTVEHFEETGKGRKAALRTVGGFLGGAVGFLVAGPVGAAVGAGLGGYAGDAVGDEFISRRTVQQFVGMDATKLHEELSAQIETLLPQRVVREIKRLSSSFHLLADHARAMDKKIVERLKQIDGSADVRHHKSA